MPKPDDWPFIAYTDYDPRPDGPGKLYVTFAPIGSIGGGTFLYDNVPQSEYDGLKAADDKDAYFHDHILGRF